MKNDLCPCKSSLKYKICCALYHEGKDLQNIAHLVRARYCAYVLGIPEYIIDTTHPVSPLYVYDKKQWTEDIQRFSKDVKFTNLTILDIEEKKDKAFVIFQVEFIEKNKKKSVVERSFFEKIQGKWFYKIGNIADKNLFEKKILSKILPVSYITNPLFQKEKENIFKIDDELKEFIEKMKITCDVYNGIGLAASQVHSLKNIFIVKKENDYEIFLNPKILSVKGSEDVLEEGCLSIPSIYGKVPRKTEVLLEYTDLFQQVKQEKVFDFPSRVFLHEIDHLKGIFFIEHMKDSDLKKIRPALDSLKERIHKYSIQ